MKPFGKYILIAILLLSACIKIPQAPPPDPSTLSKIPDYEDLVPDNTNPATLPTQPSDLQSGNNLQENLASQGIQLSQSELDFLAHMTTVTPNGEWAASQSQSAEDNLQFNFQRFRNQFKPPPATAEAYKQQAVALASRSNVSYYLDVQYYLQRQQLLVIKWDSSSGEFVILRPDGALVNYLISRVIGPPRYIQIN